MSVYVCNLSCDKSNSQFAASRDLWISDWTDSVTISR